MRNGPVRPLPCLLACLLLTGAAHAQPPPADARYADPDPAAQYTPAPDRRALRDIDKVLRREPDNIAARVQNGRALYARRQGSRGAEEFAAAVAAAAGDPVRIRYALWNHGWALFESAQPGAALEQWQRAAREHGGAPYWLPALVALVAWVDGDRDSAGSWYAAAARSDPARWESADALAATTADWPVNARFSLESVRQHWAESR